MAANVASRKRQSEGTRRCVQAQNNDMPRLETIPNMLRAFVYHQKRVLGLMTFRIGTGPSSLSRISGAQQPRSSIFNASNQCYTLHVEKCGEAADICDPQS